MHQYRSHTCGGLSRQHVGQDVRLSGWVHRKRDHGNLLFIDLRDHFGITQCVVDTDAPSFKTVEALRLESVVTFTGRVVPRAAGTTNANLETGAVELRIDDVVVQSKADQLPIQVNTDAEQNEELRLRYRFLD